MQLRLPEHAFAMRNPLVQSAWKARTAIFPSQRYGDPTLMPIDIPVEATQLILLQRTRHQRFKNSVLIRRAMGVAPRLYYDLVRAESLLRRRAIHRLYASDVLQDLDSLLPALRQSDRRFLDIGCGVAGIDAALFRLLERPAEARFFLFDRSTIDPLLHYGFGANASYYNSLGIAELMLTSNGVDPSQITFLTAPDTSELAKAAPVDLALSLYAWGYHFPVESYLNDCWDVLVSGGRLVIDIRSGTDGLARLQSKFRQVVPLARMDRSVRWLATK